MIQSQISASQNNQLLSFHKLLLKLSYFRKTASYSLARARQIIFRDCGEAFKSGLTTSGVYTLTFPNSTEEIKVLGAASRFPAPGVKQAVSEAEQLHTEFSHRASGMQSKARDIDHEDSGPAAGSPALTVLVDDAETAIPFCVSTSRVR